MCMECGHEHGIKKEEIEVSEEVKKGRRTKIDIEIGMEFGKWKVIEINLKNKFNQNCSLCKCSCGRTELLITNSKIVNNETMQCKKCNDETSEKEIKVGEKYGEWEVLETGLRNKRGNQCSRIRCSCGRDEKIRVNSIITALTYNSCVKCARENEIIDDIKVGQKFGKWTVIEVGLRNKGEQYCSKVECDCGRSIKIVNNSLLRKGKSTQCGKCGSNVADIKVNDRFGKWKVIEIGLKGEGRSNASMCECDCGRTISSIKNYLLSNGKSTQCVLCATGRVDLNNGEKYDNWTIIEANIDNNGLWSSRCVCECGTERIIKNTIILNKETGKCNTCANMTTEEYKIAIQKSSGNITLADGEEYRGKYVRIKHICGTCLEEWMVEPAGILNGQMVCGKCRDQISQSFMATALQQVLRYYYTNTEYEYDLGFKGDAGRSSKYDIFVKELNLIIECQSGYHEDKVEFDKRKKEYAESLGYDFFDIDSREYSPLRACKVFFPNITMEEMQEIVDWNKCSRRQWSLKEAQELLNSGHGMMKVAELIEGATYGAIINAIVKEQLTKPIDYITITSKANKVIQLDLDYNYIKEFRIASDSEYSYGSVQSACNGHGNFKNNSHLTSGYLWYYEEDYKNLTPVLIEELIKETNREIEVEPIELDDETKGLFHAFIEDNPTTKFKVCSCCGKLLPCHELYFSKQDVGLYGFTSQCRTCKNEHYKQMQELAECGVYKIVNLITSRIYVGSANNIKKAEQECYNCLKIRNHPNRLLQEDIIKYGEDNFKFETIEIINEKDKLLERCQFWLDELKSYDESIGYNISPTAGNCLGIKKTIEQRKQMSIINTGRITSDETKEKLRITSTGRLHTIETKEKLRLINTGKKLSEETKLKISYAHKGKPNGRKGTTMSDESKKQMSISAMGKHNGSKNPASKLTEETVLEIFKLLDDGIKGIEIAEMFDINKVTVSSIKKGRNWGWLKEQYEKDKELNTAI